jgi:hypothetical protein
MPSNEKIAIAAHLHVLLRRKTGRVTDTEWMATNLEYAAEIARFARAKAAEDGHNELLVWVDKLEEVMAVPDQKPKVPLVQMLVKSQPIVSRERHMQMLAVPPTPNTSKSRSIDTEHEDYPESGFLESTFGSFFGDSETQRLRKPRDPNAPRYVRGLR